MLQLKVKCKITYTFLYTVIEFYIFINIFLLEHNCVHAIIILYKMYFYCKNKEKKNIFLKIYFFVIFNTSL